MRRDLTGMYAWGHACLVQSGSGCHDLILRERLWRVTLGREDREL